MDECDRSRVLSWTGGDAGRKRRSDSRRGCIVIGAVMPWLADTDVGAAYGFARSIVGARTESELRGRALQALAELVPADLVTWDRIELATGVVDHEAAPADAEPSGAFAALVAHAADHPLLAALTSESASHGMRCT